MTYTEADIQEQDREAFEEYAYLADTQPRDKMANLFITHRLGTFENEEVAAEWYAGGQLDEPNLSDEDRAETLREWLNEECWVWDHPDGVIVIGHIEKADFEKVRAEGLQHSRRLS